MTKRKSLQIYLNDKEREELERLAKALDCKTLSGAAKKAISLIFNLKNPII